MPATFHVVQMVGLSVMVGGGLWHLGGAATTSLSGRGSESCRIESKQQQSWKLCFDFSYAPVNPMANTERISRAGHHRMKLNKMKFINKWPG